MSNIEAHSLESKPTAKPTTKTPTSKKRLPTPMQAIRKHCLSCSCDARSEVRDCYLTDCHLWAYRFGKRPVGDA